MSNSQKSNSKEPFNLTKILERRNTLKREIQQREIQKQQREQSLKKSVKQYMQNQQKRKEQQEQKLALNKMQQDQKKFQQSLRKAQNEKLQKERKNSVKNMKFQPVQSHNQQIQKNIQKRIQQSKPTEKSISNLSLKRRNTRSQLLRTNSINKLNEKANELNRKPTISSISQSNAENTANQQV